MIVVAFFLSLAILPTARAADETVWASDDPVENYCVAVDAMVKVYSADAITAYSNPTDAATLRLSQLVASWCADPRREFIHAMLRADPDLLCVQSKKLPWNIDERIVKSDQSGRVGSQLLSTR